MPILMQHCPHCFSTLIQRSGRHGCPEVSSYFSFVAIGATTVARASTIFAPFIKNFPAVKPRYAHPSPSYDRPATNNGGGTMNEDDEMTQLNKISGQAREAVETVKAMPPPPEWKL